MNNLFSIFDPSTGFLSLNWMSIFLMFMLPSFFWLSSNKSLTLSNSVMKFLSAELKLSLSKGYPSFSYLILITLFMWVMIMNSFSLLPYVYAPTSHPGVTLTAALPLWAGYNTWNFMFNTGSTISHLVPKGTPSLLIPLMVLIELVSNLIRPVTLSVRLAANMVAGHLLLSLMSMPIPSVSLPVMILAMTALILLTSLELAVALIQSYVFMTLTSLYLAETNMPNN